MHGSRFTAHARVRMQQRGIPPGAVEDLLTQHVPSPRTRGEGQGEGGIEASSTQESDKSY